MLPILTSITSLFTGWINGRLEVQKSKIETQKAAEANKARLLADVESHNHAWEMAQITEADKPLRRICFGILSWPFVYAIFDPKAVSTYFTVGLAGIPQWYQIMFVGMVSAVWGLSAISKTLPSVLKR